MPMSAGFGIFLVVVGAILAFAINVPVTWINLALVGWILMVAGVVVFILGLVLIIRKRRSTVTVSSQVDPATGRRYESTDRRDGM